MKFMFQTNLISEYQLQLLVPVLDKLPFESIGIIPFSHEISSDNELVGTAYIPYGSTSLTLKAKELGWQGVHFNDNFDYEVALKNRTDMLNGELVTTVGEYVDYLSTVLDHELEERIFIRPVLDLKQFAGEVTTKMECLKFFLDALAADTSKAAQLTKDTKIVVNTPHDIMAEWRWFIIDGKVVSGSLYRCDGRLIKQRVTDQRITEEAQELADIWLPDSCCVMDTALLGPDGVVKVVEFNCINCSGFYDHDVELIMTEWFKFETNRERGVKADV
jgi:hypothetical protein